LLRIFFSVAHDPTTLNRQGPDWGRQYRSAIFYSNDEQKRVAEAYIKQLDAAKVFSKPIVTQVTALPHFYPAEDYHQDYFANNAHQSYCQLVVAPKIAKVRQYFADKINVG